MNQIIDMIIRQVMRQVVHRGVNAGMDKVGKLGKRPQQSDQNADER